MEITFISTDNEKFACAYTLEKAIALVSNFESIWINVYGSEGVQAYCKRLGELRWLLRVEERAKEIDIEFINERLKFQIFEDIKNADEIQSEGRVQFHLFPSKVLPKLADYVKFLLKLQAMRGCEKCILVDGLEKYRGEADADVIKWVYGMFPRDSILTVSVHAASRQFELQKLTDKRITETIRMDLSTDRMKF